jgi:LysM repeat protein
MSTTALQKPRVGIHSRVPSQSRRGTSGRNRCSQAAPNREPSVRLTLRGRLVLMVTVVAIAFAVFTFLGSPAASTESAHHASAPTIVVRPGQTLWSIAAKADPDADPRDVVAEIMDLNDLTDPGALRVGQLLYLPER